MASTSGREEWPWAGGVTRNGAGIASLGPRPWGPRDLVLPKGPWRAMSSEPPVMDKAAAADIDAVRAILKQTSA